ncbi:MAG: LrgB family protein [Rikenellaceae bacterium]
METIVQFFSEVVSSQIFLLTLTVLVYYAVYLIYSRWQYFWFNPVLLTSLIIVIILSVIDVEYQLYYESNGIINFLLRISVIPLSYLMHKNIKNISQYKISILCSTFIGSIVGVLSVVLLARLFDLEQTIIYSLEPKSITTPIAVTLSQSIGGLPAVTTFAVAIAGVFGNALGPQILTLFGVKDSVAKGLALGSASHAIGTARAMELGALEGAVSGAAIGIMGLFTTLILPIINALLM